MSTEKKDLRVIKTKNSIKKAILMLMQDKNYEKITVQDIANEAMINRNTFYLHYLDKQDLIEQLTKESMDRLNVCINMRYESSKLENKEIFKLILVETFKTIESDIIFFRVMLTKSIHQNFNVLLKETLKKYMIASLGLRYKKHMELSIEYMCSGLSGIICLWIENSENYEIDDIITHVSEFNYRILYELI